MSRAVAVVAVVLCLVVSGGCSSVLDGAGHPKPTIEEHVELWNGSPRRLPSKGEESPVESSKFAVFCSASIFLFLLPQATKPSPLLLLARQRVHRIEFSTALT